MQEEPRKPQEELVILILTVEQLNLLTDELIVLQEVVLPEVVVEITIVLLVEVLVTEALHGLPHQEVEVALQQEEAVHQAHHPHLQEVVQDDLIDKHL
jgi:hypothetical protein